MNYLACEAFSVARYIRLDGQVSWHVVLTCCNSSHSMGENHGAVVLMSSTICRTEYLKAKKQVGFDGK